MTCRASVRLSFVCPSFWASVQPMDNTSCCRVIITFDWPLSIWIVIKLSLAFWLLKVYCHHSSAVLDFFFFSLSVYCVHCSLHLYTLYTRRTCSLTRQPLALGLTQTDTGSPWESIERSILFFCCLSKTFSELRIEDEVLQVSLHTFSVPSLATFSFAPLALC